MQAISNLFARADYRVKRDNDTKFLRACQDNQVKKRKLQKTCKKKVHYERSRAIVKVMAISQAILEQFNSSAGSNLISELAILRQENKHLQRIIEDTSELLLLTTADGMIEYVTKKLLDYFIPQFMAFVVHPPREQAVVQYCYRSVGRTDEWIDASDFDLLKHYYDVGYQAHDFESICLSVGKNKFTKKLLSLKPKLIFPLSAIGGNFGIALFSEKILSSEYTEPEVAYIEQIFKVLAVQLQNDLHYHSSITDPKTGLYTYDYFVHKTEAAIAVVQRYRHQSGIIIVDVDFFKKFNDTHGHLAGDKMLVAIASTLSTTLRKEDCLCRFGGEEFAIIVPETSPSGLWGVAERLRRAVEKTHILLNGQKLSVTISLGAYLMSPEEVLSPKRVFELADRALYVSKNLGRNRTTIFPDGLLKRAELHRT